MELLQGEDGPLPRLVEEGLFVGAIVEKEPLPGEPGAEVGPQQGEDPVLGGNLPHQHPAVIGEADKAPVVLRLPDQVADGRVSRRIRSSVGSWGRAWWKAR